MTKICGDKRCLRPGEDLPLSEFPRNKNRDDGRHAYCKECSTRQRRESREKIRKIHDTWLRLQIERAIPKVKLALSAGIRTWEGILEETELECDLLCDVLMVLMLDNEEVKCHRVFGERRYVLVSSLHKEPRVDQKQKRHAA